MGTFFKLAFGFLTLITGYQTLSVAGDSANNSNLGIATAGLAIATAILFAFLKHE